MVLNQSRTYSGGRRGSFLPREAEEAKTLRDMHSWDRKKVEAVGLFVLEHGTPKNN